MERGTISNTSDPIGHLIARTPDWRGTTLAALRKGIRAADPEIAEAVKWRRPSSPLGAPVWEHYGIVCVGNVLKKAVRLTFPAGASLPDPRKLFNARLESRTVRALDLYEGDKPKEAALKALIRSAVKYNETKVKHARARKR